MAEPIASASATIVTAAVAVPAITFLGMDLGLRADVLLAGFAGAVAAMGLLNSVPSTGDTLRALFRTSMRRIGVSVGSAATAAYLAPMVGYMANIPITFSLGLAFIIGAGAQTILPWAISVVTKKGGAS